MRDAHEVEKVRAAERALMARLPEGTLMQRAATGLAAVCSGLLRQVYGARVALLVGGGDNGGDALYAGAILARRGARVDAILASDRIHQGGLDALTRAGGRTTQVAAVPTPDKAGSERTSAAAERAGVEHVTPAESRVSESAAAQAPTAPRHSQRTASSRAEAIVRDADLVIDGLTGIGGKGALRAPYDRLAALTHGTEATIVACDIPSGVDAGSGEVAGTAVRADVTVTFGTYKPGLLIDPGAEHAGVVELIDIGLELPEPDVRAFQAVDVRPPTATAESDKYRRGVVGVIAGSERYPGAAVLSTGAAIHGGAGMVRFAAVRPVVELVRQRWPEAVTTVLEDDDIEAIGRVQAWVIGPGLGVGKDAEALIEKVLRDSDLPALVDADGLTVLARRRDLLDREAPTVITPHAGELARLLDADRSDIEARRLAYARKAADELNVTVLLKGSTTLVAHEGRATYVNATGTPRLATAGSGDVLSGLIGALLAGGLAAMEAAAAGAFLHGLAARLTSDGAPISAFDVITALPQAFRTLTTSKATT